MGIPPSPAGPAADSPMRARLGGGTPGPAVAVVTTPSCAEEEEATGCMPHGENGEGGAPPGGGVPGAGNKGQEGAAPSTELLVRRSCEGRAKTCNTCSVRFLRREAGRWCVCARVCAH
eukprot:scaffold12503_cov19-Tisochrysis_lutea.AAC.1